MPRKKANKSNVTKKIEVKATAPKPTSVPEQKTLQNKLKAFFLTNKYRLAVLAAVIIGLIYVFRGLFVAVIVNNQPISRLAVVRELEKKGGKQVLNTLVSETLILQEAQKNKIVVNDQEVNQEIKKIEDNFKGQGQSFDQALAAQGLTRADFNKEVRMQKIIEKLLAPKIKVADQEIKDYIDKNKENLPPNATPADIKTQLEQQKLRQVYQTWMAELQKKAKIIYFVNY